VACSAAGGRFAHPTKLAGGGAAVIATFALLVIIHVVLLNWTQLTNGPRTVFGVPRLTGLWTSAGWATLTVIAAYLFKNSSAGLMLRASREDEKAAASSGIDIVKTRWLAFAISAFFAGLSGALYAHFISAFGAGAFYISETFLVLAMLIIGGSASVSGAVIGTAAVTLVNEAVRPLENAVNIGGLLPGNVAGTAGVVLSVAMILLLILRPAGLLGGHELSLRRTRGSPEQAEPVGKGA
jgi:branched-chain amino acid transport system permease protein